MLAGAETRVRAAGVVVVWVLAENCMVGDLLQSGAEATPWGLQLAWRKGFNGEGLRPSRASPEQVCQVRESSDLDPAWPWAH